MRIEFLTETGEPPSLLRMFAYTPSEFADLCGWFLTLAESSVGTRIRIAPREGLEISGWSGFEAVVSERDQGIAFGDPARWLLSAETWSDVLERARALNPLDPTSFQWLVRDGSTPVVLSLSGQW
jgi:hypothetical protein